MLFQAHLPIYPYSTLWRYDLKNFLRALRGDPTIAVNPRSSCYNVTRPQILEGLSANSAVSLTAKHAHARIVWPGTFVPGWRHTCTWSRKGLNAGSARLPTDRVLFHAHTTHSVTVRFAVAEPRDWNSLPANLRDEDITYTSFRREFKTYWFSCGLGAMWHSA